MENKIYMRSQFTCCTLNVCTILPWVLIPLSTKTNPNNLAQRDESTVPKVTKRIGLRRVELVTEADSIGESFFLR